MDSRTKGIIFFLLCFVIAAVILQITLKPNRHADIRIIYTANIQGNVSYQQGEYPGYEKISAAVSQAASSGCDQVLTVDAGSCLGGGATAEIDSGQSVVSMMNAVGYNFLTPGAGEFVYDTDQLGKLSSSADFGFYAANVSTDDGSSIFKDSTVVETGGTRILLTGVTDALSDTDASDKGITISDPSDAVSDLIAQGNGKYDAVIVIACLSDSSELEAIAGMDGVSLVINSGPAALSQDQQSDKVISASDVSAVGMISLTVDRHGAQFTNQTFDVNDMADMQTDTNILGQIQTAINALNSAKAQSIGEITVADDNKPEADVLAEGDTTEEDSSSSSETVLHNYETGTGDLITDAMLNYAEEDGAEIALIRDIEIQSSLESGSVTLGDVLDLFDDDLCMVSYTMTGGQLSQLLNDSYDGYSDSENFLQAAGITYTYTNDTTLGSSISSLMVGENDIDDGKTYTVVTTTQTAKALGFDSEIGLKQSRYYGSVGTVVSQMIQNNTAESDDDGSRITIE